MSRDRSADRQTQPGRDISRSQPGFPQAGPSPASLPSVLDPRRVRAAGIPTDSYPRCANIGWSSFRRRFGTANHLRYCNIRTRKKLRALSATTVVCVVVPACPATLGATTVGQEPSSAVESMA
jgi:hypothetical protein